MKRVDANGATVGLKFTDGDPGIPIIATLIEETWLNDKQEELVNIVLDQKDTLDQTGVDNRQLQRALGMTNVEQTCLNNQVAGLDITGLFFPFATFKSVQMHFDIERRTDTLSLNESGNILLLYDNEAAAFKAPVVKSSFDDAEVTFLITGAGQLQYASSNMAGANYAGKIRILNVKKIVQTA